MYSKRTNNDIQLNSQSTVTMNNLEEKPTENAHNRNTILHFVKKCDTIQVAHHV